MNPGVGSVGTLDYIGSVLKVWPRVGPTTSVAAKGVLSALSISGIWTPIPSAMLGECPLSLAGTYLGLKCLVWGSAHGFACNGPDIGIFGYGFDSGLNHCFQSLVLMRGCEGLQNATVGEVNV